MEGFIFPQPGRSERREQALNISRCCHVCQAVRSQDDAQQPGMCRERSPLGVGHVRQHVLPGVVAVGQERVVPNGVGHEQEQRAAVSNVAVERHG